MKYLYHDNTFIIFNISMDMFITFNISLTLNIFIIIYEYIVAMLPYINYIHYNL